MKTKVWRIVAILLAVVCMVLVVTNLWHVLRFDSVREHHLMMVGSELQVLTDTLQRLTAGDVYFGERGSPTRELRELEVSRATMGLFIANRAILELAEVPRFTTRYDIGSYRDLRWLVMELHVIVRAEDDPTIDLQKISDILLELRETMDAYRHAGRRMSLQGYFDAVYIAYRRSGDIWPHIFP